MNIQKMIKTAKTMDTVTHIVEILVWISAGLMMLGLIAVFVITQFNIPEFVPGVSFTTSLSIGNLSVRIDDTSVFNPAAMQKMSIVTLVFTFPIIILLCILLRLIRKILKPMKEGRPFDTDIPEGLKKCGWIVLISGVLGFLMQTMMGNYMFKVYDLSKIFNTDVVSGWNYTASFDLKFVAFAFMLFLLSNVFAYGQELQKESDETL